MIKMYEINDVKSDGFLHSVVDSIEYNCDEKNMIARIDSVDLKDGDYITTVTLSISDWMNFEVLHIKGHDVIKTIKEPEIPELDSIIDYEYDGNTLILEDLCGRDEVYRFVFLNPKIKITGEYEPD